MSLLPPAYWGDKAKEVRTKAESLHDPDAKATMLDIASKYERLAQHAAARGDLPKGYLKQGD